MDLELELDSSMNVMDNRFYNQIILYILYSKTSKSEHQSYEHFFSVPILSHLLVFVHEK